MNNKTIVEEWIAENRIFIDNWTTTALQQFWNDTSVRVPRTLSERADGLAVWLEGFRLKMRSEFEKGFRHQFASMSNHLPPSYVAEVFDQNVWPEIKPDVHRYAMYGFAAAWAGRYLGDATTIGAPVWDGQLWHVPLGIKGHGDNLGQIVLDADGEVIAEQTTTRISLLEAIRSEATSVPSLSPPCNSLPVAKAVSPPAFVPCCSGMGGKPRPNRFPNGVKRMRTAAMFF